MLSKYEAEFISLHADWKEKESGFPPRTTYFESEWDTKTCQKTAKFLMLRFLRRLSQRDIKF